MNIPKQEIPRDYGAISPSATSLLLLKGITSIPFAKKVAELISLPGTYNSNIESTDLAFWKRVVHFESRYWSINQLLSHLSINNILELSSGYSFRGLETVIERDVTYIDTDLPDVINHKKDLLEDLQKDHINIKGNLQLVPLNALNENQFTEIVNSFPEGPLIIINEGLLMYLNNKEKQTLSKLIYKTLEKRGGFWITGDIYIKSNLERLSGETDDALKELVSEQRIEDNMFESFAEAKAFFKELGFVIDKEAEVDYSKVSSLKNLFANATESQLIEMQSHPKIQTTWCLKIESNL